MISLCGVHMYFTYGRDLGYRFYNNVYGYCNTRCSISDTFGVMLAALHNRNSSCFGFTIIKSCVSTDHVIIAYYRTQGRYHTLTLSPFHSNR